MIIDNTHSNIETIGNIEEFKTSIDPKNIEFITTLLSSNLYSNPEQSFIRETVSNAWDSHVEANTTDIPIIIKITSDSVIIRDYGTGLSPERFNEVYRNVGSSTKRESNNFHGGFGIGHLSCFACKDTVYITSYYNGIAYSYLGSKVNNTITYHKYSELPTEEKNGVEIQIKDINPNKYIDSLVYIAFFPNVYIECKSYNNFADKVNNSKIKRYNNFVVHEKILLPKYTRILLGNVLYPIDYSILSSENKEFLDKIHNSGIVIAFNIGELNITPNRESIIYSSDTVDRINNKLDKARKELYNIVSLNLSVNYDDIVEYKEAISTYFHYNLFDNAYLNNYTNGFLVTQKFVDDYCNITYKGVKYNNTERNIIVSFVSSILPYIRGIAYRGTLYISKFPQNTTRLTKISNNNILILKNCKRLDKYIKSYILDKYSGYAILYDMPKYDIDISSFNTVNDSTKKLINDGIHQHIIDNAVIIDVKEDKDFLAFKEQMLQRKDSCKPKINNVILYIPKYYNSKRTFDTMEEAVKYIKDLKKGVILTNMDVEDSLFNTIAKVKKLVHIKARKDIVAYIKGLNLRCIVDADWLLYKDPLLSIVKSLKAINKDTLYMYETIKYSIPLHKVKIHNRYIDIYRNIIQDNFLYTSLTNNNSIPYDSYTSSIVNEIIGYVRKYMKSIEDLNTLNRNITTAVLVKKKAYIVSKSAYLGYKNDKLIKLLCRK